MASTAREEESNSFDNYVYIEEISVNDGESKRIPNMPNTQNVESLKRAIAEEVGQPDSWEQIEVVFASHLLKDPSKTLASYGIEDGDTIFFSRSVHPTQRSEQPPPPYPGTVVLKNVFFKDIDNKTYTLFDLPISSTVKAVRDQLAEAKSIEMEYYRLLWGGKQLEDGYTLEHYGLQNNATVHMVMRLKGGEDSHNLGRVISLIQARS